MKEASLRRTNPADHELVTKVEESPYGGYRVRSIPADFYVDQIADGPNTMGGWMSRRWPELTH